ncbi:HigA family addiction module antitoxin [Flavobacterium chilense]|uniref:Addiction module antidote protein, HigA family n=1 Tax=Flavobacterium chilense TaxID=946677 RepID=A0A1M7HPW7_9FLAO|nr:HigA family addiction module antitoxin [Flavobacterium chilense]SHM30469.1 addiction module antidote protein, HigA family [Flavobacterium chilense]
MDNNDNFIYNQKVKVIHPGIILRMELIDGRNLSIEEIAKSLNISPTTVGNLFEGLLPISSEIAINISSTYGGTPEHFIRLQNTYDLNIGKS